MEPWKFLFVCAALSVSLAAVLPDEKPTVALTSELAEGFHVTVPKTELVEDQHDDDDAQSEKQEVNGEQGVSAPPPSPGLIATIQQGIANFTSLVNRPSSDNNASRPTIFQNLQDGFQNIVNPSPSQSSNNASSSGIGGIVQGVQIQIQSGLANISQAAQNLFNPNNDSASPGVFQQGLQNLQQVAQQGFNTLNATVQNVQQGIQNVTSTFISPASASSDEPSTQQPTIVQQVLNSFVTSFTEGVSRLNTTFQSILNPSAFSSESATTQPPNLFQSFQQGLQSFFGGGRPQLNGVVAAAPVASQENVRFDSEIAALNATLIEGIRNITQHLPAEKEDS